MKREASKVQCVQMYAHHPNFCIKAVPLPEFHQLQVWLKREVIFEQLGSFNSDVLDEAAFCTFFKRHWKVYLVKALFSVQSVETFARNDQFPLRSRFKNCLVEN